MRRFLAALCVGIVACAPRPVVSSPGPVPVAGAPPIASAPLPATLTASASATLADVVNTRIGTVTFTDTPGGLLIAGSVTGLGIGAHGVHLHSVGRCQPPDFASAGPHFNPSDAKHGFKNPSGHHAGDLPNIVSPPAGRYAFEFLAPGVKLTGRRGLIDDDGASIVIHAVGDDHLTDPAGNSGGRFACGVITLSNK